MTSGPFAMELGETQEIVLALIGGHGSDFLNSLNVLWENDRLAQAAFDSDFLLTGYDIDIEFAGSVAEAIVNIGLSSPATGLFVLIEDVDGNTIESGELFDDGNHSDGTSEDLVFGNLFTLPSHQEPLSLSLTIYVNGEIFEFESLASITTDGPLVVDQLTVVNDENEDFLINPGEQVHLNLSVENLGEFSHPGLTGLIQYTGPIASIGSANQNLDEQLLDNIYGATYDYGDLIFMVGLDTAGFIDTIAKCPGRKTRNMFSRKPVREGRLIIVNYC